MLQFPHEIYTTSSPSQKAFASSTFQSTVQRPGNIVKLLHIYISTQLKSLQLQQTRNMAIKLLQEGSLTYSTPSQKCGWWFQIRTRSRQYTGIQQVTHLNLQCLQLLSGQKSWYFMDTELSNYNPTLSNTRGICTGLPLNYDTYRDSCAAFANWNDD